MNTNENSEISKNSENSNELLNINTGESYSLSGLSASEKIKEWLLISQDIQAVKRAFRSFKNVLLEFVF